jgi:hypothetical protein
MSTEEEPFEHPLARKAKVWKARSKGGKDQRLLVVVTTLTLGAEQKGFNERNFKRLSQAASEFVSRNSGLDGYVLINRAKDWGI